jgi:hypothetical protein
MQIRPRTYLHLFSLWRSLRDPIEPRHDDVPAGASPLLTFIVIVLAILLAILEADAHRGTLESLGLSGHEYFRLPPKAPLGSDLLA